MIHPRLQSLNNGSLRSVVIRVIKELILWKYLYQVSSFCKKFCYLLLCYVFLLFYYISIWLTDQHQGLRGRSFPYAAGHWFKHYKKWSPFQNWSRWMTINKRAYARLQKVSVPYSAKRRWTRSSSFLAWRLITANSHIIILLKKS